MENRNPSASPPSLATAARLVDAMHQALGDLVALEWIEPKPLQFWDESDLVAQRSGRAQPQRQPRRVRELAHADVHHVREHDALLDAAAPHEQIVACLV